MKLLFVAWNFPPRVGGAERLAGELARTLGVLHSVRVLTGRGPGDLAGPAGVRRALLPGALGFLASLSWRLPWALARHRPRAVLAFGAGVGVLCRPWTRLFAIPQAIVVLGTDVAHRHRLYRALLRPALRGASRVLAISRAAAGAAVEAGARPECVEILPPGLDARYADEPAGEPPAPRAAPALLFVGRVIARKGLLPFVEHALPLIFAESDAELWVIGDDAGESLAHATGELARVRAAVESRGLASRVRFLGRADDGALRAAYRHAALLLLPAVETAGDIEGFGLVFLEAALFGVPAVATRLGGIPEAVLDGETGLLLSPGDWRGYARCVVELLHDNDLRARLGRQARARARAEFNWDRVAERWSQALERMVDGREPARRA